MDRFFIQAGHQLVISVVFGFVMTTDWAWLSSLITS